MKLSSILIANSNNSRNRLLGVGVDDTTALSLPIDTNDNAIFAESFVPPPPRPLFLEDGIMPDGLTTCDLCSWAWQTGNPNNAVDSSLDASSELGWILTLVIVSLTSAVLGAIIMIIVLHFKKLKKKSTTNQSGQVQTNIQSTSCRLSSVNIPDDKAAISHRPFPPNQSNINGVWSWLSRRPTTTSSQLNNAPMSFVENHYTHMEDPYDGVDDAFYSELDVENIVNENNRNPAYRNSAYTDSDAPTSSAPSSAYYSDLSVTTCPDRAYEVVGLTTVPVWDAGSCSTDGKKQATGKLAVISETVNVPSDYI